MPERSTHTAPARAKTKAPAESERPPGKPDSQVEAEAPPPADVAEAWAAEYAARMPEMAPHEL